LKLSWSGHNEKRHSALLDLEKANFAVWTVDAEYGKGTMLERCGILKIVGSSDGVSF
jgi:hypothetical protein